jgi:hypothetical protein
MSTKPAVEATALIQSRIGVTRGHRVLLDADLASVYGVSTSQLNQAVKRNMRRFPSDFAFQLSASEWRVLRSQIVISDSASAPVPANKRGGRRTRPWVFTEHGAMMAATVLSSPKAVQMSVFVVRAFVRLRKVARAHAALAKALAALERRVSGHDLQLRRMVEALRKLLAPPLTPRRRIGFSRDVSS